MARRSTPWVMGMGVPMFAVAPVRADNSIGFAHETYVEDHSRMTVQTETVRGQVTFSPWLDLTARGVYDGISGATPIGAPAIDQLRLRNPLSHFAVPPSTITGFRRPLDGISGASPVSQATPRDIVPLAGSRDTRRGIDLLAGLTFGNQRFLPEISYSAEHDYISYSGALNYVLDVNEKNTTLNLGWAHSYDQVLSNPFTYLTHPATKNTDDFIAGVSQVLSPTTLLSANGTISHSDGYLNDPYRSVVFQETDIDPNARVVLRGENRPRTRDSQAILLTLTQAVPPANASVEGTYRFYHDSYGIVANTLGIAWMQKFGRAIVISPSFRYYRQSAADFYGLQFPGDPVNDPAHVPRFYSSDYRLSSFESFTLGLEANIRLYEHFDLYLGYQRYWMHGLDGQTLQATYPSANVFTIGVTATF